MRTSTSKLQVGHWHNKSTTVTSKGMMYCVFAFRAFYYNTCTSPSPKLNGHPYTLQQLCVLVFVCVFEHITDGSDYSLDVSLIIPFFLSRPVFMAQPGVTNSPFLQLGLSWWMWVVIGVGCLLVVVLMVVIICLCKRIKRKKVSKENHLGNLHMLLCRFQLVFGMKKNGLLKWTFFFSVPAKIAENEEWPPATESQAVLPV